MQPEQPVEPTDVENLESQDEVPVSEPDTPSDESQNPIQWQAPEYVQERRSPWWFIIFWVVVVIIVVIAAFLIKSITFVILVPVMAAALMLYSHRPPRELTYVLSEKGLYINEQLHQLAEFRAFGVAKDETIPSLMLIPTKRFRPALSVHFPAEYGEAIVDFLGGRIPMQELKLDVFDRLIRKLHV